MSVQFTGTSMPGCVSVYTTLIAILDATPEHRSVKCGLLVTDAGCEIIERNATRETNLRQTHGSLLADECVSPFDREHGVVL